MNLNPLSGMKIVNIGFNLPGPLVSFHLQKFGATIVKVEPPAGDPLKAGSPTFYNFLVQNQKVAALDLKNGGDRAKLDRELQAADLLITSSRPDSLQRMGLGWKDLHAKFPKLCVLNIVGFAAPNQNRVGHDITYQAFAGLLRPPELPVTFLADFSGAHEAALQALALLFQREKTGEASTAESALTAALDLYAAPLNFGLTQKTGMLGGALAEYNLYQSQDGWVAVAVLEPQFQAKFISELGLSSLDKQEIERVIRSRTSQEWQKWAEEKELPVGAVRL